MRIRLSIIALLFIPWVLHATIFGSVRGTLHDAQTIGAWTLKLSATNVTNKR